MQGRNEIKEQTTGKRQTAMMVHESLVTKLYRWGWPWRTNENRDGIWVHCEHAKRIIFFLLYPAILLRVVSLSRTFIFSHYHMPGNHPLTLNCFFFCSFLTKQGSKHRSLFRLHLPSSCCPHCTNFQFCFTTPCKEHLFHVLIPLKILKFFNVSHLLYRRPAFLGSLVYLSHEPFTIH